MRTSRRSRLRLVVVGALVAAVSGVAPPGRADAPRPVGERWEDCVQQIGVFPVDESQVEQFLPPGFSVVAFQDSSPNGRTPAPAAPGATATLQLTATSCLEPGRRTPTTLAQVWIYVDPPEPFRGASVDSYVIVPWAGVTTTAAASRLRHLGLPVSPAVVANELGTAGSPVRAGRVGIDSSAASVEMTTRVPVLVKETTPERIRLIGVRDRTVLGAVDFVEDAHTHLLAGSANVTASRRTAFPVPSRPGVAIHVEPGYGVTWQAVSAP